MSEWQVILVGVAILLFFFLIVTLYIVLEWLKRKATGVSPYTGAPLRPAESIPFESKKKILQYLFDLHEYDNPLFEFRKAAFCRETGRIFTLAINWLNVIHVDWSFLQKRYPGTYVSWGSLSEIQQETIRQAHGSLEGFQTAVSSGNPSPRNIEQEYAFKKPGPLYVDINSQILLGWKVVPKTQFEVLIVQKPTHLRHQV